MSILPPLPTHPAARLFAIVAYLEAITWTGLLIGMFLKYVTDTTERGVELFGPIHGMAFIAYVLITVMAAMRLRWQWWVTLVALLAAVPPFGTIVAERWLARRGDLDAPQTTASSEAA
ncbi:MAG: DUF3817 domain-containing protein [Thermomicrobiales bacterium]|nr:DUF3817 domain-containing protein [Thermomicrobiales bacterium]